jgi:heme/copper-type cytochrome/quinol oxidase subunit 3
LFGFFLLGGMTIVHVLIGAVMMIAAVWVVVVKVRGRKPA